MRKNKVRILLKREQFIKLPFLCILFLITSVIETVSLAIFYPFMTSLLTPENIHSQKWYSVATHLLKLNSEQEYLIAFSALLIVMYLVKCAISLTAVRLQIKTMADFRCDVSKELFAGVINQPYSNLKFINTAEIQRTLTNDVSYAFDSLSARLTVFQQGITGIALSVVLISLDPILAVGIMAIMIITLLLFRYLTGHATTSAGKKARTAFIGMMQTVRESFGLIKQVIATNRRGDFYGQFNKFAEEHAKQEKKAVFYQQIPKIMFETLIMVSVLIYIICIILLGNDMQETLPQFITFSLTTVKLIPVVTSISSCVNRIRYCEEPMNRVCGILSDRRYKEIEKTVVDNENSTETISNNILKEGIEGRDVLFAYEDGVNILNKVNFSIPANSITAFVGKTGAGKTTLADVLLGLYDVKGGQITADGHDLTQNRDWWASCVGYMTQDICLQDATIKENILMGYSNYPEDDEQIWNCLEMVGLASYFRTLKDGLNTRVGENGSRLSGGQAQRLAIAKMLYAKPSFLVMDESTSALDSETEKEILDTLSGLKENHTILLITHRDSALSICDLIYRVENGRVECVQDKKSEQYLSENT